MVLATTLYEIIHNYKCFTINQMKEICEIHNIPYQKRGLKSDFISRIEKHNCSTQCLDIVYVFKERSSEKSFDYQTTNNLPRFRGLDLKPSYKNSSVNTYLEMKQFSGHTPPSVMHISAKYLNENYKFEETTSFPSTFHEKALIVQANVHSLLNSVTNIELYHLRELCIKHYVHLPPNANNKQDLLSLFQNHKCNTVCNALWYIFIEQSQILDSNLCNFNNKSSLVNDDIPDINDLSHLEPPSPELKISIIKEWEEATSAEALKQVVCAVCSIRSNIQSTVYIQSTEIDLKLLRNDELHPKLLPQTYSLAEYNNAILNPNGLENKMKQGKMRLCNICYGALKKGDMPKFALSNFLYYGQEALPEQIQTAFSQCTIFERMLICRARSNSICFRLRQHDQQAEEEDMTEQTGTTLKNSRRGIRGNVIVSPLDVIKTNKVLPPSPASIADTLCAIFVGSMPPTRDTIRKLSPVLVRKNRVKLLIEFLLEYNQHYRCVPGFQGYSEQNLNALFSNDRAEDVPTSVHIGHIPLNEAIVGATSDYTERNIDYKMEGINSELLMENVSYTLGDDSPLSYRKMKVEALERCLQGKPYLVSGKGTSPLPDFNNPYLLSWLFPHLDPWGIGGFLHPLRKHFISVEQQVKHLLQVDGGLFQNDSQFAFIFYNILRKQAVSHAMRFTTSYKQHSTIIKKLMQIDPELLNQLKENFEKDALYKPINDKEKSILQLLASVSVLARNIPGSDGYKITQRNRIRGLIYQKSTPTLFVTLNPADVDNPIVRLFAGEDINVDDITRGEDMDSWHRKLLAAQNPAACALFFDMMIKNFIKIILRFGNESGLYGKCTSYYATVEAQGKGTLHCHMLIWLYGHPSPQELRNRILSSPAYATAVTKWMESSIRNEFLQLDKDVLKSCKGPKLREKHTLVGNPHPGSIATPKIISYKGENGMLQFWRDYVGQVNLLLHTYNWHNHSFTCWKYLHRNGKKSDANCRMRINGDINEQTIIDPGSGVINLRRLHPWIAPYTDLVLYLLKCNMDIKFVGSGEAAKAFLFYVTDYITKPSLPVYQGIAALCYALRRSREKFVADEDLNSKENIHSAIITTVNSMMGKHEISHQQVMSYLIGGGDYYTPEEFTVLNWHRLIIFVNNSIDSLAKGTSLHNCHVNDNIDLEDEVVQLSLDEQHISASNQQLDYIFRPEEEKFNYLCFYQFVATVGKRKVSKKILEETNFWDGCFSDWNHPQRNSHQLYIKTKASIPVILGPKFSRPNRSVEEHNLWAKEMLIMFKPWRTVEDLKSSQQTWEEAYSIYQESISPVFKRIINNIHVLSECKDARDKHIQSSIKNNDMEALKSENDLLAELMEEELEVDSDLSQKFQQESIEDIISNENLIQLDSCTDKLVADELQTFDIYIENTADSTPSIQGNASIIESVPEEEKIEQHNRIMIEERKRRRPKIDEGTDEIDMPNKKCRRFAQHPIAEIQKLQESYTKKGHTVDQHYWDIVSNVIDHMSLHQNIEQLRAFMIIVHHVFVGDDQLLMHVSGVGGTGKSHLISAIVLFFEEIKRRHELMLSAPTGIAAVLIKGFTLHALLLMSPNWKSKKLEDLNLLWSGIKYLIIDEVSMLGASFLSRLSLRLSQAQSNNSKYSSQPFGGINVIFMGDFGQLKPPRQSSLYSNYLIQNQSFNEIRNEDGISAMNGVLLWRQIKVVVNLVFNQRHAGDPDYSSFLSRLRLGKCLQKPDVNSPKLDGNFVDDFTYICSRLIENVRLKDPDSLCTFWNAPIIVGTKSFRDLRNAQLILYHAKRLGQQVHIYHSTDIFQKQHVKAKLKEILWNISSTDDSDTMGKLQLFPGMRVMVTENLAFGHGIVNGSEGIIQDIKYYTKADNKRYLKVVYVFFENCMMHIPGLDKGVVPIFPSKTYLKVNIKLTGFDNYTKLSFTRVQVPLVPAYCYTDYKSQGRTLEKIIVDLFTARGQGVYVMLSRVKTLKGLLILRWFPATKIYQRLPEELRQELSRLEQLADKTTKDWNSM